MTRRLFFALAGLAVLVLVVADAVGRENVEVAERRGAVIDLERRAFGIALHAQDHLEAAFVEHRALEAAELEGLRQFALGRVSDIGAAVLIADGEGNAVTVAPRDLGRADVRRIAAASPPARAVRSVVARTVELHGVSHEVVEVPVVANVAVVGRVFVVQHSSALAPTAGDRLAFVTPAFLAALVLALLLAWLLASRLNRPIHQLAAASQKVARDGVVAPRVEPAGPAELRALADAFNAMSVRVRALVDRQGQFASDVSHQLRTPLTTLSVAVERTLAQGAAGDIDGAGESLRAVSREVTRLHTLVEGLLVLTSIPAEDAPRQPVDVARVTRERVDAWTDLAREQEVGIKLNAPVSLCAFAVEGAVDQIVDNLLDNALEVAPAGTQIDVEITTPGRAVTVAVADRGAGLSEVGRARAFERFWRADATVGEGLGIGLTIVRDLAEACGGAVELLGRPGGGTRAVLTLVAVPRTEPVGAAMVTSIGATSERLRVRLAGYLRARDPGRAEALTVEVWQEAIAGRVRRDARVSVDDEVEVFALAHARVGDGPRDDEDLGTATDVQLLRTIGGLTDAQICRVLDAAPDDLARWEAELKAPEADVVVMPARVGRRLVRGSAIAAAVVVVATGTAAATGSLPDPMQRQVARVLRSVGIDVPAPVVTVPRGAPTRGRSVPAVRTARGPVTLVDESGSLTGLGPVAGAPAEGREDPVASKPVGPTVPSPAAPSDPVSDPQPFTPPGQAKKEPGGVPFTPPGQAKKESDGITSTPPGQAKKESDDTTSTPPGQAKKNAG